MLKREHNTRIKQQVTGSVFFWKAFLLLHSAEQLFLCVYLDHHVIMSLALCVICDKKKVMLFLYLWKTGNTYCFLSHVGMLHAVGNSEPLIQNMWLTDMTKVKTSFFLKSLCCTLDYELIVYQLSIKVRWSYPGYVSVTDWEPFTRVQTQTCLNSAVARKLNQFKAYKWPPLYHTNTFK